jgi:hypothetical protein
LPTAFDEENENSRARRTVDAYLRLVEEVRREGIADALQLIPILIDDLINARLEGVRGSLRELREAVDDLKPGRPGSGPSYRS